MSLGRIGESAKARVVVSWLWYLQGLSNFFGSCLGYPFLWYPTAALFAEELTEIYSTDTPNAMAKAKKIVLIKCLCPLL